MQEPRDGPPVRVATVAVDAASAGAGLVLPARVRAREEVTLTARFPGSLSALPVREGGSFRAGQTLAVFAAPEAQRAMAAAEAAVAAAATRLSTARAQHRRAEALYAQKVIPQREVELADTELRAAEAAHAAARAEAQRVAADTRMRAPFDGVVVRAHVDRGSEVVPGQPLLHIRSGRGGHEIEVAVPESELPRLDGARVWCQVGDSPWHEGRVDRVEGMTDPVTRTRTMYVRPAGTSRRLEPGAFARVRFEGVTAPAASGAAPSFRVPLGSLVRRGGLTGVYVIRDGRARLRWVRLGSADAGSAEVLAGLWTGERVAASTQGLRDGRAVEAAR